VTRGGAHREISESSIAEVQKNEWHIKLNWDGEGMVPQDREKKDNNSIYGKT